MSALVKPEPAETPTPNTLLQLAVSQGADLDKLTKLMELQERWEANEARKAFTAAMARFKSNPPQITKNKHVKFGQTEYDHATLDHVTDQLTKGLSAVGISHKWVVEQNGAEIVVSCVLTHEMGHSEKTTLKASPDTSGSKNAIQAIGSAVTYLERYTLLAATGMAAGFSDDDGHSTGMPDQAFAELMEPIEAAMSKDDLQKAFARAYKAAEATRDSDAMRQFIAAKDRRKAELR